MKFNEIFVLREKIEADNRKFETKEKQKEREFLALTECIVTKVDLIEDNRAIEMKYLRDIEEFNGKLKKLGIDYLTPAGAGSGGRSGKTTPNDEQKDAPERTEDEKTNGGGPPLPII